MVKDISFMIVCSIWVSMHIGNTMVLCVGVLSSIPKMLLGYYTKATSSLNANNPLPSSQVVLSDGSLLLRSVSMESGGDYQCIVWFGNHLLEGPILQLHISEGM